jgi:hypothetical protein
VLQPWTCQCGQTNVGPAPCSACLNAAPASIAGRAVAPPPRPRFGRAGTALAVLTAVLLVAGLVSAAVVAGHDDDPTAGVPAIGPAGKTVEVTPDSVPGAGASALESALPGHMRFVQETRGLPFTKPVEVTLLPDKAFRQRLRDSQDEDEAKAKEELQTTQRVLEGLGLLDKGVDLKAAIDSLYGDAVAGFYDTEKDDLVVRGEALTVSVRTTLVHELTHALQDQHFDIERKDLDDRDDEASTGLTGLVEGDATRVERLYAASLSPRERKQGEAEEAAAGAGIDPDIPRVLLQLVAFPYIYGPTFTTAVFEQGGQARLDQAYREPPTTSEQLLHPEVFLDGEAVQTLPTPKADGEEIDQGVMGELVLLLVLNTTGIDGRRAATGWGGDRYIAWKDGKDTCVRVDIAMDTPQDDAELHQALDRLVDARKGATVTGQGPFELTSCG